MSDESPSPLEYGLGVIVKTSFIVLAVTETVWCAAYFTPAAMKRSMALMSVWYVALLFCWGGGPLVIAMVPPLMTQQRAPARGVLFGVIAASLAAAACELAIAVIGSQFITALGG